MAKVCIIGGGIGGLTSAALAAKHGADVTLFESAPTLGGKLGTVNIDGIAFDTGPSLLTLHSVFRDLYQKLGSNFDAEIPLVTSDPSYEFIFADGQRLATYADFHKTLRSVSDTFGPLAANEFQQFLAFSAKIYQTASPTFIFGTAPGAGTVLSLLSKPIGDVLSIDPTKTMLEGIEARVKHPALRTLLMRYATYNGSDVRRAPSALNCIAHVELELGGTGVKGGLSKLAESVAGLAERLGATLTANAPVLAIEKKDAQFLVRTASGKSLFDAVIFNCDVAEADRLLPKRESFRPLARLIAPDASSSEPSMSAWNGLIRATGASVRSAHSVIFPKDYLREFVDIFDRRAVPDDPTVYVCAQRKAHEKTSGDDMLFCMVNAPAAQSLDGHFWSSLERKVRGKLAFAGFETLGAFVWTRTPKDLAARFPGSMGSIYGPASNGALSAFGRRSNRGSRGVYYATGSAHPGGGVPMACLSGQRAFEAFVADFG